MVFVAIISKIFYRNTVLPVQTLSIKPNNHRIYQCPQDKKIELLNKIIADNAGVDIIVVTANDADIIKNSLENQDIRVFEDKELVKNKELKSAIVIGFDMPIKDIVYIARASRATEKSFMLLDESEQNELHFIERLLGRAIKQEKVEGFEYIVVKKEIQTKPKKPLSKDDIKEVAKKRYEKSTKEPKKSYDKPKKKDDRWAKKKKAPNKFLGKDENGKAIFSGKTGDRNHRYDGTPRDKYDAPKVTGKKINIKALKPKKED